MSTRPAAVANLFYPGDPEVLHNDIQHYLAAVSTVNTTPKAIIVPHAGYIYSGPVAAHAYAQLLPISSQITRVVLLGPCHRIPVEGLAVPSVDYFETPLGKIPLDRAAIDKILQLPQVNEFDLTHEQEHSLEVQLPFLQETLDHFSLVPLVVGDASTQSVQQVIDTLWGGDETLIVISAIIMIMSPPKLSTQRPAVQLKTLMPVQFTTRMRAGAHRLPLCSLLPGHETCT